MNQDIWTTYLLVAPCDVAIWTATASLMNLQSVGVERAPTVLARHEVRLQHTEHKMRLLLRFGVEVPCSFILCSSGCNFFSWVRTFRSELLKVPSGYKPVNGAIRSMGAGLGQEMGKPDVRTQARRMTQWRFCSTHY